MHKKPHPLSYKIFRKLRYLFLFLPKFRGSCGTLFTLCILNTTRLLKSATYHFVLNWEKTNQTQIIGLLKGLISIINLNWPCIPQIYLIHCLSTRMLIAFIYATKRKYWLFNAVVIQVVLSYTRRCLYTQTQETS